MRKKRLLLSICISAPVVTLLTIVERNLVAESLTNFLFLGEILSLLITGGHGGTQTEEFAGAALSIIVNTSIYSTVLFTLIGGWRRKVAGNSSKI